MIVMARQISVSDEVYEELSKRKGGKSFSEYIRESIGITRNNREFLKFAGIWKKDAKKVNEFKKMIAKERKQNLGREFNW